MASRYLPGTAGNCRITCLRSISVSAEDQILFFCPFLDRIEWSAGTPVKTAGGGSIQRGIESWLAERERLVGRNESGWLAKFERSAGNLTEASAGEMGEVCWQR